MRGTTSRCILAPFALCGASTSASSVGAVAQVNAEALAGLAFTQLVRPGSPQIYGQFMVTVDMKIGRPDGRNAGGGADDVSDGGAGAEIQSALAHLRVPCRLEDQ